MSVEERRDQLIDVAVGILRRSGPSAITIDAVARGAGVTRPVVYRVFTDVGDLLEALLDREEARALGQVAAILPIPGTGDPVELTLIALRGFLEAVLAAPDRWAAILAPVESMPEAMQVRMERSRLAVRQQIQALVAWAIGPTGGVDTELFARGLQALCEEAGRLVLSDPEAFPPERIQAFAATLLSLEARRIR